jgi:peptide/nickel transport system substrate-binding protein
VSLFTSLSAAVANRKEVGGMPWRKLLHRSRFSIAILSIMALIVLVEHAAKADDAPKRGGGITLTIGPDPNSLDCHAGTSIASLAYLAPHYSTLLRYDPDAYPGVIGDVAESWSASADNLTYTFRLHSDVLFHDGSKLTARDVKATYDRLRHPPPGVISVRQTDFADIDDIEVADPLTVVFHIRKPNAGMVSVFASPWNCLYSAARLADDPNFPAKTVMGTGPFVFSDYIHGARWTGKRFDRYFKPGLPYLDRFSLEVMSQSAYANAIIGGQLDGFLGTMTPADRDRIRQARGATIDVYEMSMPGSNVLTFNTRRKPFDDVRVRQALTMAVDRWGGLAPLSRVVYVKSVGGVLRSDYELSAPVDHLTQLPGYGRDIDKSRDDAKRLLAEAGVTNLRFKLLSQGSPLFQTIGVFLIDQWRRIGVSAELEVADIATFLRAMTSGNYDVGNDFSTEAIDEPNLFLAKYISSSSKNFSGAADPILDDLFERQKRALDPARRRELIDQFQDHALRQAYMSPIYWAQRISVLRHGVRGFKMMPSHFLNQDLANLWIAD